MEAVVLVEEEQVHGRPGIAPMPIAVMTVGVKRVARCIAMGATDKVVSCVVKSAVMAAGVKDAQHHVLKAAMAVRRVCRALVKEKAGLQLPVAV